MKKYIGLTKKGFEAFDFMPESWVKNHPEIWNEVKNG
jgi:hypothetical protein